MILLSHPTGNSNFRAVVTAFYASDFLAEFHLSIAACGGNFFELVSHIPGMSEVRRRTYSRELRSFLRLHPSREVGRILSQRLGLGLLITHETGVLSIDAVYRNLDCAVARRILTYPTELSGIYAYEDGAFETFAAGKKNGLKCFYDLPIAFWSTSRRLLQEEAQRLPEWEQTLIGTRDSKAKCDRKDAELELADAIFCPSDFVRDSLPTEVLTQKKVFVSPFGSPQRVCATLESTHNESGHDFSHKLGQDARPLRVFFAGSMTQRKGLADLFAAMKLLDPKRVELHILGSPIVSMDFYRTQFSNFVYHATRSNEEVLKLMRTMDVFCLPSIVEGRALVIQEAMSQGLPIIITPNTGGEDLVDVTNPFPGENYGRGATGFLVPIRAPEKIAESIQWFCDHREEVAMMGNAAIAKSSEYTWTAYGNRIVQAIRELSAARSTGNPTS